jgi:hypothetical protein
LDSNGVSIAPFGYDSSMLAMSHATAPFGPVRIRVDKKVSGLPPMDFGHL